MSFVEGEARGRYGPFALKKPVVNLMGNEVILIALKAEPQVSHALRNLPNAVLLPHVGSVTLNTRAAMGALTADNLLQYLNNGTVFTPIPECADM